MAAFQSCVDVREPPVLNEPGADTMTPDAPRVSVFVLPTPAPIVRLPVEAQSKLP